MKQKGVDFIDDLHGHQRGRSSSPRRCRSRASTRCSSCRTVTTPASIADNADLLEGSIVVPQFVAFEQEPQIPEIKTYLAQMEKIGKDAGRGRDDRLDPRRSVRHRPQARRTRVLAAEGHRRPQHAHRLQRQRLHPPDRLDQAAQRPGDESRRARGTQECANFTQVKDGKLVVVWAEPGKPWACFPEGAAELGEPTYETFVPEGSN